MIWQKSKVGAEFLSGQQTHELLLYSQTVFILTCRLLGKRPLFKLTLAVFKQKTPFITIE